MLFLNEQREIMRRQLRKLASERAYVVYLRAGATRTKRTNADLSISAMFGFVFDFALKSQQCLLWDMRNCTALLARSLLH